MHPYLRVTDDALTVFELDHLRGYSILQLRQREAVGWYATSTTAAGGAAGVAFEAGAVAHQGEFAAFAAAVALIALHPLLDRGGGQSGLEEDRPAIDPDAKAFRPDTKSDRAQ